MAANRIKEADLVEWLRGFGERLLASPAGNEELGRRLVLLGELSVGEVGDVGYEIGVRLLGRGETNRRGAEDAEEEGEREEGIKLFAEAWFNQGNEQFMAGDLLGAIASFDKALKFKPDYYEAWNNRGNALDDLGEHEKAIAYYDKALEIKPDYPDAWHNRGVALGDLGQYENAIASYDKALEIKPDFHKAWINRGIAAGRSVSYNPLSSLQLAIVQSNPALNQRGYEGELASYQEGLTHCHKDSHPEGWGKLNQAIGNAHYFQGRISSHPRAYWHKAIKSYNEVLNTLEKTDFHELYLEVLQNLIRVRWDLGEIAKSKELQRRGTDLLRRLLDECKTPKKKKQLALKFAGFQQFTVDLAVQSGNWCAALELAEQGKNACLSWLLDGWSDASPTTEEMQQLLNPTTAIVYWHLSPYALHTFILKHNAQPIVLQTPPFLRGSPQAGGSYPNRIATLPTQAICRAISVANKPSSFTNSSNLPCWTIRPASSTKIRSALRIVLRRWAITMRVTFNSSKLSLTIA
ncbi:protein prenyltransferase, alpha subunit [Cylindrospermum sp. NIES-4074]|nr:protein prenyltransferase, alpha subunit [Cylindrospermum sp. NIES-4074]